MPRGFHGRRSPYLRRGLTLIEILVAVAIISVLAGLLLVAGSTVQKSFKNTQAKTQFAVLANAIEQYTQAWKPWTVRSSTGALVPLADKGLPDWSGRRLFASETDPLYGGFFNVTPINDASRFGTYQLNLDDDDSGNANARDDLELAGECLAWGMFTEVNGGPFVKDAMQGLVDYGGADLYPSRSGTESKKEIEFKDPWGNPLRYVWVARDSQTHYGFRAVLTADYTDASNGALGAPNFAKAAGYILESAGPDGLFGNEWRRYATNDAAHEASEAAAADNILIKP